MKKRNAGAVIMASEESSYFADLIAQKLHIERFNIIRKRFGDGERYYRLDFDDKDLRQETLAGKDVIYVSSTHSDKNFLDLYRIGCALAVGFGTKKRVFAIPFWGYSTMERAKKPGEIVVAKSNARMLSCMPKSDSNSFLMMDLHVSGILHYFEGPCYRSEVSAEEILSEAIENLIKREIGSEGFVFGSADLGRPKLIEYFARRFSTNFALVWKEREFEKTKVVDIIGDVKGKHVIIYDDMTRSASSLIQAAEAYLERGASSVFAVLSHLALNSEAIADLLEQSPIRRIISTNSHPMSQSEKIKTSPKFIIKDVSPLFADAIRKTLV
ncbi:MAG: ribose-phosphate diphosphokinase [bacterium]|nr:ribose-phosphate diphosphokinase [bacterium]